jgi:hypothetical protein
MIIRCISVRGPDKLAENASPALEKLQCRERADACRVTSHVAKEAMRIQNKNSKEDENRNQGIDK